MMVHLPAIAAKSGMEENLPQMAEGKRMGLNLNISPQLNTQNKLYLTQGAFAGSPTKSSVQPFKTFNASITEMDGAVPVRVQSNSPSAAATLASALHHHISANPKLFSSSSLNNTTTPFSKLKK